MTTTLSPPGSTLDADRPKTDDPTPLRAVHTLKFPALLRQLGASLLVTTYHEMASSTGNELWVVNTRFSCLCTLDGSASFLPRWRPPFVSTLEPTDHCHLNGLGMADGRPRYATALGKTDASMGWRPNKAGGGIVMEVASGEVITRGLSMPHPPRWYASPRWVCESARGRSDSSTRTPASAVRDRRRGRLCCGSVAGPAVPGPDQRR